MESDDDDVIRPDLGYTEEVPYDPYTANGQIPANSYFPPQQNGSPYMPLIHNPLPYSHPSGPSQPLQPSRPLQPEHSQHLDGYTNEAVPIYIPPPQVPNHSELTEKERVRQAETRLLPSQPPAAGPSSTIATENIYDAEDMSRPPQGEQSPDDADGGPSAPTMDDISIATATPTEPMEDKQERERRRLLNEASLPPEFPEDMRRQNGGPSHRDLPSDAEPSAPVLDDEDNYPGYGSGAGPSGHSPNHIDQYGEQLPAYQR